MLMKLCYVMLQELHCANGNTFLLTELLYAMLTELCYTKRIRVCYATGIVMPVEFY